MSFNKLQDFEAQAKELESQMFDAMGKLRPAEGTTTSETPVPEVTSVEPTPAESNLSETITVPDPPKSLIDEEKYKASVKAMNEAQREAAELRKFKEESVKSQRDLEERINELVRQSKAFVAPEPEDDLETDMPEVAKIAERYAKNSENRVLSELTEIKKRLEAEEKARKDRDASEASNRMRQAVIAAHPDFDDVVNSEAMQAWVNNEAPPIFKSIYDGSVPFSERDVIAVVSQFKSTLAPKAAATSKPSASDIAAPVRTSPVVSTSTGNDAPITEAELNDFMHNAQRKTEAELKAFNARLDRAYGKTP
jgi:hypothetical protein